MKHAVGLLPVELGDGMNAPRSFCVVYGSQAAKQASGLEPKLAEGTGGTQPVC